MRLHGRRYDSWFSDDETIPGYERYNYLYSEEELRPWADRVGKVAETARNIYVITNNHYQGKGVVNALQLISMLKGSKVKVPEPLRAKYPELEKIASEAPQGRPFFEFEQSETRDRYRTGEKNVTAVAGVDLGGTAVNYTLVDEQGKFLVEDLCEHPSLAKQGPEICLGQIADGLKVAANRAGIALVDVVAVGLDTPGPASSAGLLSARGSTNFVHANWAGFDIREGLAHKLGKPVSYLNDANAAALWGHYAIFGRTVKRLLFRSSLGRETAAELFSMEMW